jgi:hypothetical protein
MERDLVDPVAVPVVGTQLGRIPVRLDPPGERLGGAGEHAEPVERALVPGRALAMQPFEQRGVAGRDVVVDERRRLIRDGVRRSDARTKLDGSTFAPARGAPSVQCILPYRRGGPFSVA